MAWLDDYNKRITLTTDHTLVDSELTDFPVLVNLSGYLNFDECDPAGLSVIITQSDGVTPINFDRALHDYANELGEYRFKAPSVHADYDDIFYLYYKMEEARWEQFLTPEYIDTYSNLAYSVNRPTKYASNPIFGNAAWTWDRGILQVVVLTEPSWEAESAVKMWYHAAAGAVERYSCYAYSSFARLNADPTDWTRPILGQVTYGGNTNNNIINVDGDEDNDLIGGMFYDVDTATYVMTQQTQHEGTAGCNKIYTSSNPTGPWTLQKTLPITLGDFTAQKNGFGTHRRSDGRWINYTQHWDYPAVFRSIGAYASDTENLDGDWTDLGTIIPGGPGATNQRHSMHTSKVGGLVIGMVEQYYNYFTELHISRGGADFYVKDLTWVSCGSGGSWDALWLIPSQGVIYNQTENEWWHFYASAATDPTGAPFPWDAYVGLAKIGYLRIGQIACNTGTGYVVTKPISPQLATMYVNFVADGAGDKIEVELLNASDDSVITNFAQTDCDDLTGDSYSTEVTWGANKITDCTESLVKIKFYLTMTTNDVKLHAYMIGDEADCFYDCSNAPGTWDDNYLLVSHQHDDDYRLSSPASYVRTAFSKTDQFTYRSLDKKGSNDPLEIINGIGYTQDFDGSTYIKTPWAVMTTAMWQRTAEYTFVSYYEIPDFTAQVAIVALGQGTEDYCMAFIGLQEHLYDSQTLNRAVILARDVDTKLADRWITPNTIDLETSGWLGVTVSGGIPTFYVNGIPYTAVHDYPNDISGTMYNTKTIIGARSRGSPEG